MTLDDSIKDLTAAITGNTSKIVHYTQKLNTLENNLTKTIGTTMTRLIAVGKEQVFSEGALAREFRNTGLSLKESLGLLSTSISVGLRSYDSGAKRLLTTVTKLGLNQNSFADMMAYNTEILGMSSRASTKLADHIVSLGREFGIDSNLLVKGLRSLEGTTRRYAIQYGGAGASNLQRVATTVAAALGPQYAGGVSKLIDLVAGSTVKDYSTGAMFGGTGLAGDASPSDMMDKISKMSGSIVDMASNYGVFGSELPFMVDIFGKSLRIDQEMLQLARKIDSTPGLKESLGLEIARQMDVTQMKYDVKRNIKSLIASFEATLLPYAVDFTKWLSSNVGNMSKFVDDTMQQIAAKFKDWNVRGSWQKFLKTTESAFKDLLTWTQGQLPHLWSTHIKPAVDWVSEGGKALYNAAIDFGAWLKDAKTSAAGEWLAGKISFGDMLMGLTVELKKELAILKATEKDIWNSEQKHGYRQNPHLIGYDGTESDRKRREEALLSMMGRPGLKYGPKTYSTPESTSILQDILLMNEEQYNILKNTHALHTQMSSLAASENSVIGFLENTFNNK